MSGVGQVTKRLLVGRPYASDRAMEQLHLPTARAFAYARETRPETLTALPVETGNADTRTLQEEWERRGVPVPLTVLESPYREITRPVQQYAKDLRRAGPGNS